eukprot:7367847-Prymnesium_polylepis.2
MASHVLTEFGMQKPKLKSNDLMSWHGQARARTLVKGDEGGGEGTRGGGGSGDGGSGEGGGVSG